MNIQPVSYISYSNNSYNRDISLKGTIKPNGTKLLSNEININGKNKKGLKNLIMAGAAAISMLVSVACNKMPQPTEYEPTEIHQQIPPTNDTVVLNEYNQWCEENWPLYLRPDYFGPVPENIDEIVEQWHQEVINWWKEHGIDFNPWDEGNP